MSDTPRTDEVELHYRRMEDRDAPSYVAPAEFARQLERENTELSDQLMRWFKAASPYATPRSLEQGLKKLKRELAEALNVERCYQELFNGPSDAPTLPKEYMGEYERMEEYRLQKEKPSNEVLAAIVYGRETGYALALRDAAEIAEHYAKLMNSEAAQRAADEIRAMKSEP